MSQYDTYSLHDFLVHTPESGLRKILVDNKRMTDVHCNLLLKIAKGCDGNQFTEFFEKGEFPKLRFGPAEKKIQEKFWGDCTALLLERGILQPATHQKVAA